MSVQLGDVFCLEVWNGIGAYLVVNDMNAFSKSSTRSTTKVAVFKRALPHTVAAARDVSYTVSGFLNPTDAGQNRLRAMEAADTADNIRVTHDGTNGFVQQVKVTELSFDADPETLQEYGFSFEAEATAVIEGTGPIF